MQLKTEDYQTEQSVITMAIKDSINLIWESLLPLAPHLASLGLGLGIIHKNNYKMHHPLLNKPTFGISCL